MTQIRRSPWLIAIASLFIFMVAMNLYIMTASPGIIVGGDVESESAQLQRVANRLGIAHSTGYPLHTLLGYGAARLADAFDQNPYTWITYTSAVASALALVLFFRLGLDIGGPVGAMAATLFLMVTNTFWYISTITETQALNALCIIGVWWMIVVHLKWTEKFWPLVGMAMMGGIGLANHRTILFSIGAAGLAVLLTGRWLKLGKKQWVQLLLAFIIPVLSYGYMFIRAQDAAVVYSTRPTWFPADVDNAEVVDIIRGTLQSGEGLEGNIRLPDEDAGERWIFVRETLRHELPDALIVAGLLGLALLTLQFWRLGPVLVAYAVVWILFLMSWRLDWKSVIYIHGLTIPLIMGLISLVSFPLLRPFNRRLPMRYQQWGAAIFALPLILLVWTTYQDNKDERDLSHDTRGTELLSELVAIPPQASFYTGGWTPDTFILLEYLDDSGRRDVIPTGDLNAERVAAEAQSTEKTVIIGPSLRGFFGLYSGSTFFHDQGLAFSGTASPLLFQIRPPDDARLMVEAEAATIVQQELAPGVDLYSYTLATNAERLTVTIYWQATAPIATNYSVFVHGRDYGVACQEDQLRGLLAQDDAYGTVRNMHPTYWWQVGEIVKDTYFIEWPNQSLPAGASVVMGMTENGNRTGELCVPLMP